MHHPKAKGSLKPEGGNLLKMLNQNNYSAQPVYGGPADRLLPEAQPEPPCGQDVMRLIGVLHLNAFLAQRAQRAQKTDLLLRDQDKLGGAR
jgi:hypothetical protein